MKSKGKKVKIMNKVAYMIEHDQKGTFYKTNPKLSAEQNEQQRLKIANMLLDQAENRIDQRLSQSLHHNKKQLTRALSAKQTFKASQNIDKRIETGILFFGKGYDIKKSKYYDLKKKLLLIDKRSKSMKN